jgi:hypothetical protein
MLTTYKSDALRPANQVVKCCVCSSMPTSSNDSFASDEQDSGSGSSELDMELNDELLIPISVPISTAGVSKDDLIRVRILLFLCQLSTNFVRYNVTRLPGPEVCSQQPPSSCWTVQGSAGEK